MSIFILPTVTSARCGSTRTINSREIRGEKRGERKKQSARNKKGRKKSPRYRRYRGHRRCKSGAILFSPPIFLPRAEILRRRDLAPSDERANFLRVSHLGPSGLQWQLPGNPLNNPTPPPLGAVFNKMRVNADGGRFLFIAFRLETAAKSERGIAEREYCFILFFFRKTFNAIYGESGKKWREIGIRVNIYM